MADIAFRDAQGRLLTAEQLQAATGPVRYEMYGAESVTAEAKALHERGREAGGRGHYEEALALFTKAASLAPQWPYPVYDRAYTHLLTKNFDAALADYRRTVKLAPRGFFTALTAVDTLVREQEGEFPQGLYLTYLMLEQVHDTAQRRDLLGQFTDKYPRFAPGWQKLANLETDAARSRAIDRGLAASPDPETKGMLLLNKALVLHGSGDHDMAVRLLRELVADPNSTLATEALAKAILQRVSAK